MKKSAALSIERGGIEREAVSQGLNIAGVDEVGRGCIAGPVYAACVILDFDRLVQLPDGERSLIRDSKQLSHEKRSQAILIIDKISIRQAVGIATVEEIERLNILQATFTAMKRAILGANVSLGHLLLVDGNHRISGYDGLQRSIIKGDRLCFSIAAASIIAKEARDQYMREQAQYFPEYGFANHVGYGTPAHLAKIAEHGPCPLHRRTFEPIRSYASRSSKTPTVDLTSS